MIDILQNKLNSLEQLFNNKLPKEVYTHINFFEQLDKEYTSNAKNNRGIYDSVMFSRNHIKNKNWKGLWLHATGIDKLIYISWLTAGLTHLVNKNLKQLYLEAHPKERYIPYSIIVADEDSKKFHNQ